MNKELIYTFRPIFALSGIILHSKCAKNVKVKKKSLEKDVRTLYTTKYMYIRVMYVRMDNYCNRYEAKISIVR